MKHNLMGVIAVCTMVAGGAAFAADAPPNAEPAKTPTSNPSASVAAPAGASSPAAAAPATTAVSAASPTASGAPTELDKLENWWKAWHPLGGA